MNPQETVAIKHVVDDVALGAITTQDAVGRIAEIIDARNDEPTIVHVWHEKPSNPVPLQPYAPLPGTNPEDWWTREIPKDEKITVTYANDKTGGQAE